MAIRSLGPVIPSIIILLLFASPSYLGTAGATNQRASSPDKGLNSLAPNYDYHATGFNPQTQITTDNVNHLELKWIFPWPESQGIRGVKPRVGSISQPLIIDGVIYARMEDLRIFAINSEAGRVIWSYQAPEELVNAEEAARTLPVNLEFWPSLSSHVHSFSYFEGRIYAPWPNCQVIGINAKTGLFEYKLQTPTCAELDGNLGVFKGLQAVGPVFDGKRRVLIYGTGGRESVEGGRGAFRGYSLDTGKLLWTFYLMPRQDVHDPEWALKVAEKGWIQGIRASSLPREVLLNDWGQCPENCGFGKGGIGTGWGQWAVDEERGVAYLATGNPSPLYNGTYRPGPNVFGSSVIALKTESGELLWWHQVAAHDVSDLDCAWNSALATINGRKMLFKQCKGALLYALDALTGEAIWKTDYSPGVKRGAIGPQPNADGLFDPMNPSDMKKPWTSYPSTEPTWRNHGGGAEGDVTVAYGKVYSTTYHYWLFQRIMPVEPSMRDSYGRILLPLPGPLPANATVWAHDTATGKVVWKHDVNEVGIRGGVTVSGGLVWYSTSDGRLHALDAQTGKLVWERYQGSISPVQPVFGADSKGRMRIFSLIGSGGASARVPATPGALLVYGLPDILPEPKVVTKEVIKEVVKEVPKEVIREVPKEVIKEVPKEIVKEVPKEVVKQEEVFGTFSLMAVSAAVTIGLVLGAIIARRRPG